MHILEHRQMLGDRQPGQVVEPRHGIVHPRVARGRPRARHRQADGSPAAQPRLACRARPPSHLNPASPARFPPVTVLARGALHCPGASPRTPWPATPRCSIVALPAAVRPAPLLSKRYRPARAGRAVQRDHRPGESPTQPVDRRPEPSARLCTPRARRRELAARARRPPRRPRRITSKIGATLPIEGRGKRGVSWLPPRNAVKRWRG